MNRLNKIIIVCESDKGGIFDYSKMLYKYLKKCRDVEFIYSKKRSSLSLLSHYSRLLIKLLKEGNVIVDLQSSIWPISLLIILIKKIRGFKLIFEAHDEPFSKKLK